MAMSRRCISLISRQSFKISPRSSLSFRPLNVLKTTPLFSKFSAPRQYSQAPLPKRSLQFPALRRVRLFSTQGEHGDAQEGSLLRSLKTSQSVYEKDISKWEELSTLLIKVGMYYESLQKEEKAEEFFRRAVQLYELHSPSSAAAHVILGNTLSRLDKLEEARDIFGQAVQKLEKRAAEISSASSSSSSAASSKEKSSSLNLSRVVGGALVEEGDAHQHHHGHHKQDPSHDVKIGLIHAYDGLIKSQMRCEGIPSAIPLIRLKLLPALKQLDAPQRVESLHEWLKITLAAQREIVELQTVPGIGDFALANEISALLLSSLEELQHSQGVLLDVLLDRATIQFSQHKYTESLQTVQKAMDVWRQHVRSSASDEIRNAVDLQLMVMLARRYHASARDLSSERLRKETDRLADLNKRRMTYNALEPELRAAIAAGEEIIPPLARPQIVKELPEGQEVPVEEGRDIFDTDTSGVSQYESAIRFFDELQRKSATKLEAPFSDLYITALVGLYHLLVEREWFFQAEKNQHALDLLQKLRHFDPRQLLNPDPLTISAYFVTEAVRFHSAASPEYFSFRLALVPRRSAEVYVELTSPDYPNQILYKSPLALKQNQLVIIELKDLKFISPEVPQLSEFHLEVFESRAKAKRLAIHKEFVVPTLDIDALPQQQQREQQNPHNVENPVDGTEK